MTTLQPGDLVEVTGDLYHGAVGSVIEVDEVWGEVDVVLEDGSGAYSYYFDEVARIDG